MISTRRAALDAGFRFFCNGKPCRRGHFSDRRADTGDCVECKRGRTEDPEKRKVISKRWRERNADSERARCREYGKQNPGKQRIRSSRRRAREMHAPGSHTLEDLAEIRLRQLDRCFYCGARCKRRGHFDHLTPISKGGSDAPENLRLSCSPCNLSKADKVGKAFDAWLSTRIPK